METQRWWGSSSGEGDKLGTQLQDQVMAILSQFVVRLTLPVGLLLGLSILEGIRQGETHLSSNNDQKRTRKDKDGVERC